MTSALSPASLSERSARCVAAVRAIDAANTGDPNEIEIDGVARPKEQAHAEMACRFVLQLDPDASDLQIVAARAHHLRRWALPRAQFPEGRAGYLRWRAEQKRRHAAEVAEIVAPLGFGPAEIDQIGRIIRKEALQTDPAAQTHEDALCLVFLASQFHTLADDLGDSKTVDVLVKTLRKMSDRGIGAAGSLPLDAVEQRLLGDAVALLAVEAAVDSER